MQDGCNQFCTYCIIPYARGRIRSKKTEDVVNEVKRLAASGCQEVVLTGIHLSSYGKETPGDQENLLTLIRRCINWTGLRGSVLVRWSRELSQKNLQRRSAVCRKCARIFICLYQSGCTTTLKRMNRRYTAERVPGKMRNPEKILSGTGTDDRCDHRISGRNGRRI